MSVRIFIGLLVLLIVAGGVYTWRARQRRVAAQIVAPKPSPVTVQAPTESHPVAPIDGHPAETTASTSNIADESAASAADSPSNWKKFVSSEYNFEVAYPPDWHATVDYENNYGKPPSGHGRSAYAGETRLLMSLEMDGPTQSEEGGGEFSDGVVVTVRITGPTTILEDWTIGPGKPWSIVSQTPAAWIAEESSFLGGDKIEKVPIASNEFTGTVERACSGKDPCTPFGESGGAYRVFPDGRALVIDWERMNGANDFSYDKYFLPMLASCKSLK